MRGQRGGCVAAGQGAPRQCSSQAGGGCQAAAARRQPLCAARWTRSVMRAATAGCRVRGRGSQAAAPHSQPGRRCSRHGRASAQAWQCPARDACRANWHWWCTGGPQQQQGQGAGARQQRPGQGARRARQRQRRRRQRRAGGAARCRCRCRCRCWWWCSCCHRHGQSAAGG
jgi:hypothetical protein